MWMANTRPGQRRAQASNNAVESAPPLNATARGKAGANACRATSMDWVMAPGFLALKAQRSDQQPLESTHGYKHLDRGNSSWAPIIAGPFTPAARCMGGDAPPLATQPPGGDSRGAAWAESVVDRRKVATTSDSRTD